MKSGGLFKFFNSVMKKENNRFMLRRLTLLRRTASYTGVGRRQIVEIIKYFKETGDVLPTKLPGNRTVHKTNIPSIVEQEIRQLIFKRHLAGEICNSNHIQDLLQTILKREIPLRTIQNHLDRMGFSYSRTRKKTRQRSEKLYVRQQRHSYLYHIRSLREEGYKLVYLDESFLHHYQADINFRGLVKLKVIIWNVRWEKADVGVSFTQCFKPV